VAVDAAGNPTVPLSTFPLLGGYLQRNIQAGLKLVF